MVVGHGAFGMRTFRQCRLSGCVRFHLSGRWESLPTRAATVSRNHPLLILDRAAFHALARVDRKHRPWIIDPTFKSVVFLLPFSAGAHR